MPTKIKNTADQLDICDSKLIDSSVQRTNLAKSRFKDVGLQGAVFDDTSLEGAKIVNSNLKSLAISDCNVAGMTIDGIAVSDLMAAWKNRMTTSRREPMPNKQAFRAEEYIPRLDAVIQQLATKAWFASEGWMGQAALFTQVSPPVASLHVFKKHWFNSQRQGIHFETFVGAKEARKREVPVMLHLLHTATIPGTKKKRTELSMRVVDACFETVSGWTGYRFKVGKYGVQPFLLQLAYDDEAELSRVLVTEFARMCRYLGPVIDRALKDVLTE